MTLHEQLVAARKRKGLTQEELAEQSKVTVRTIQRIESGETVPRAFTLKAIAAALDVPFETLQLNGETALEENRKQSLVRSTDDADSVHFLQTICLSCFSFILLPFFHFLIPSALLRRRTDMPRGVIRQGRQLVRGQIFWVIGLNVVMLVTVGFNLYRKSNGLSTISYLVPAAAAYAWNLVFLLLYYFGIRRVVYERLLT